MKKSILTFLMFCSALTALAGALDHAAFDFKASLTTTNGLTNTIASVFIPSNTVVRIETLVLGNVDQGSQGVSVRTHASFINHAGVMRKLGGTATLGRASDFITPLGGVLIEACPGTGVASCGTTMAEVRVAGDNGKTFNWTAQVSVYYSDL